MGVKETVLTALLLFFTGCQTYKDIKPIENGTSETLSGDGKYIFRKTPNGFYAEGPFERKVSDNEVEKYRGRIEYLKESAHGPLVKITATYYWLFPITSIGYDGWESNRLDHNLDRVSTIRGNFDLSGEIVSQNGFPADEIKRIKNNFQSVYPELRKIVKDNFGEDIPVEPDPVELTLKQIQQMFSSQKK